MAYSQIEAIMQQLSCSQNNFRSAIDNKKAMKVTRLFNSECDSNTDFKRKLVKPHFLAFWFVKNIFDLSARF